MFALAFVPLFCRKITGSLVRPDKFCYFVFLVLTVGLECIMMCITGGFMSTVGKCYNNANTSYMVVPNYTLFSFLAYDYILSEKSLDEKDLRDVGNWIDSHKRLVADYCALSDSVAVASRPDNLVYIICESLESWPIGLTVEGKEITPYLNSLISDTTSYFNPRVLSQVKGGRSIDCQLMTLAGLQPVDRGAFSFSYYTSLRYSVPAAVGSLGTRSCLLSCDSRYVWNQASVAESMGIDSLLTRETWNLGETGDVNVMDGMMTDGALFGHGVEKFKNEDIWPCGSALMSVWITRSGHNPFKLDGSLDVLKLRGDYPSVLRDYLTVTAYVDSSLKILIDYLKGREDWNRTVVVITGDHEGLAGYRKEIVKNETLDFVEAEQFVPLIVLNSSRLKGKDTGVLGQIDIYPTLLDVMGLYGSYGWKGVGFSALDPSRPVFAFGSQEQLVGDTTAVDESVFQHRLEGSRISDMIIRYDLLSRLPVVL